MQEIQNTVTEMKNAFDGLISRLDMAKYKLENTSGETTQTKKQRKKDLRKTQNIISKNCRTITNDMGNENTRRRRKKGTEEIFETMMSKNFSQINVRQQIIDSERSEDTRQDKCQKKENQKQTKRLHLAI